MPEPRHLHLDEDTLVELALGTLSSDAQAAGLRHLATCPACRSEYDELAAAVDGTLVASPAVAPPTGFEARVLAGIGAGRTDVSPRPRWSPRHPSPRPSRRPSARPSLRPSRWPLLAAAALVVGVLLGGWAGSALRSPEPAYSPAAGAVALRTASGDDVGEVFPGKYAGRDVLVMRVDGGPGRHYTCRLQLADGSTRDAGEWSLPESGSAVWIIDAPAGVTGVEMVADSGTVWSSAELPG